MKKKAAKSKRSANQQFTDEQIADEIWEQRGLMSQAARALGMSRQHLYARLVKNPSLKSIVAEARELQKDRTESKLFAAIEAGEAWAICFYLKTQTKDRGYIERVDWALAFAGKIDHTVKLPIQDVMAELEKDPAILEHARMNHPHLRLTLREEG